MPYLIGILLALAVFWVARSSGLDRTRAFYPALLAVVALLYVLFAATTGSIRVVATELGLAVPFLVALALGYRVSIWWIAAGLAGHGLFDSIHSGVVANPGVPIWWPAFCASYDVVAAVALGAALLIARRRNAPIEDFA